MSEADKTTAKKCEIVVEPTEDVQKNQNNTTNTLKSVRKKIRKVISKTRKSNENFKSDSIDDQKEMNQDKSGDESYGKSKITIKKIFRKSSFKKFISNIQHFTNYKTVSLFIHEKNSEVSIVKRKKNIKNHWIRTNDSPTVRCDLL